MILASDASENTTDRIISLCKKSNIKYVIIGKKEELGNAVGKGLSSIISITDLSFSEAIVNIIDKIV
ncbi:ribosomal L7Ae/L30e/S12e/Gadd45 family protein [Gottschalkia acidurici]|uniref:L7Ae/L30e/S12e/Gadd45 family ribosomal protein n=1 Tax=Clostridium acidurici TaxID=1556 RepID=UPI0009DAF22E